MFKKKKEKIERKQSYNFILMCVSSTNSSSHLRYYLEFNGIANEFERYLHFETFCE